MTSKERAAPHRATEFANNQIPRFNAENITLLLESAPIAMVTIDQSGQIVFVNAKLEEMFGFSSHELVGQKIEVLLPHRFRGAHIGHRIGYIAEPRVRPMGSGLELLARRKDGSEFPVEIGLSYVNTGDDLLVMGSIADITLRKQAEETLERRVEERTREIERRRQVADSLRDILAKLNSNRPTDEILNYIVKQAGRLLNAQASAVYSLQNGGESLVIQASQGLSAKYIAQAGVLVTDDPIGQVVRRREPVTVSDIEQMLRDEDVEFESRWQTLLTGGYRALLAVPLTIKEEIYGSLVLYYARPRNVSAEGVGLAVAFGDQVALAIENARLRTRAEEAAVVAERDRLARDLHDSVTQTLFSASVIADVLPRLWDRDIEEGKRRLAELRQLARGAMAEMRTLLLELRPSRLTEVELGDLLRQLSEAITGRSQVPIELNINGDCTLPPDVQIALYRTAQEALNNVAKHAHASQATVNLNYRPDYARLSISDNGRGFNKKSVSPNSLGLTIMRERAEAIDATLEIDSHTGQGTQVAITWHNHKP